MYIIYRPQIALGTYRHWLGEVKRIFSLGAEAEHATAAVVTGVGIRLGGGDVCAAPERTHAQVGRLAVAYVEFASAAALETIWAQVGRLAVAES